MLVFAGDSITTAPAQTLTDKEYQRLRDASIAIIRDMGVKCGGSNTWSDNSHAQKPNPSLLSTSCVSVRAGDSITIAPAQTLTDKEYQRLRDASIAIIRDMGVECGGSNVQMAVNPDDGQVGFLCAHMARAP